MTDRPVEEKPVSEQLVEGSEHSLGEKVPGGPFAMVGLSYLLILILVSVVIITVLYLF